MQLSCLGDDSRGLLVCMYWLCSWLTYPVEKLLHPTANKGNKESSLVCPLTLQRNCGSWEFRYPDLGLSPCVTSQLLLCPTSCRKLISNLRTMWEEGIDRRKICTVLWFCNRGHGREDFKVKREIEFLIILVKNFFSDVCLTTLCPFHFLWNFSFPRKISPQNS